MALLSACSDGLPAPTSPAEPTLTAEPRAFDPSLEAAAAVLPLVPQEAERLTVTDLDRVRDRLGLDVTSADPAGERAAFWTRVETGTAVLSRGLLRPTEDRLLAEHGISQADVAWEAHFADADGTELGWVLAFRAGTDPDAVAAAVGSASGPFGGAAVVADGVVARGAAADPSDSWSAVPGLTDLVGPASVGTYVELGCVVGGETDGLEPLEAFSVGLEGVLATARLGPDRLDLFERVALAADVPAFARGFEGGVADPGSGRIGYRMVDPTAAAALVLRRQLPFAACAP